MASDERYAFMNELEMAKKRDHKIMITDEAIMKQILYTKTVRRCLMSEKIILSEKLEDNKAAAEWGMKQAELIRKGEEITQRLTEKYTSIILSRNAQGAPDTKSGSM